MYKNSEGYADPTAGLALLRMCDEVWVFGKVTPGVASEIKEAKKLKKQIRYFEEVEA